MADDSPIFEGRVPFPVKSIHGVILRLLYQATMHFEGHLKAINMLADSFERRSTRLWKTSISSACSRSKRAWSIFFNSISSNSSLLERMKHFAEKLGLNNDQVGILEDLIIENKQCYRRAEIHAQVLGNLMGTRASTSATT